MNRYTIPLLVLLIGPPAVAQTYSRPVTVQRAGHKIDTFIEGKRGPQENHRCEDGLLHNDHFLVVVDGATDKSGKRYAGNQTGGRVVRGLVLETFAALSPDADKATVVNKINARISAFYAKHPSIDYRKDPIYRLTASLIWYNFSRRELAALGDCKARIDGRRYNHEGFFIDTLTSEVRALAVKALNMPRAALLKRDLSQLYIKPLIQAQASYQNNPQAPAPLAFWIIDGFPVPQDQISSWRLKRAPALIELSSDGYPGFPRRPKVADYEARLRRILKVDPLCVKECRSTKGLRPGQKSFDDRALLIWHKR